MKVSYLIFVLASMMLFPAGISDGLVSTYVQWNIGQGSWGTYIETQSCLHIDMGGDFAPSSSLLQRCRNKKNFVILTHYDRDHINLQYWFRRYITKLAKAPRPLSIVIFQPSRNGNKSENSKSLVIFYHKTLNPGDSTKKEELLWSYSHQIKNAEVLVLGHHGSHTSTSVNLLQQLKSLKWSISSARKSKYNHPHQEVVKRLKQLGIPVLKTESWGNIYYNLKGRYSISKSLATGS